MPWPPLTLQTPLRDVRGVGSERAGQLAKLKAHDVMDLLRLRPRRYEDRRLAERIKDLQDATPATVRGEIVAMGLKRFRKGSRSVFELIVDDGSARLHCRWWNLPYMQNYFRQGDEVFVYGKPVSLRPRTMDHPETEVVEEAEENSVHLNRITPIYPLTDGLPQRWLRGLVWRVLEEAVPSIREPWRKEHLASTGFCSLREAYRCLHFPPDLEAAEGARRRLAFDEFVELQLNLQRRRRQLMARARGLPCGGDNRLMKPFLSGLGWKLTGAQTRVLRDLRKDMSGGHPMRRLVQGDVGSGKTLVAACCALMALESGFSAVLMAPTEILAEQHYRNFLGWFEPLGVTVDLQTGQRKTGSSRASPGLSDREQTAGRGKQNSGLRPRLVVGTHALVESGFTLGRLGLVVIDEQHKFGVSQREKLVRKGVYPHLLVMTATPIPRTLGLTLYGDLDISVINELPAGRGTIRTYVRTPDRWPKVLEFLKRKLEEGRQIYVVYARVEETGPSDLKAATREHEKFRAALSPYGVGLLHGRLPTSEKERIMKAFRGGELRVLLATSVIEVGVDVPNATVMVIENADQFGLAQLHQLRGRIGRGSEDAYCILMTDQTTDEARRRMEIMAETRDGFRVAEEDLRLRGPGEFLGRNQSGLPPFRFADLVRDGVILAWAKDTAAAILDQNLKGGD